MPTAIGTYATRARVKARLDSNSAYTAADDALIDQLCDQINDWVEETVGRALAPRPETELLLDGHTAEQNGLVLPVPFGINSLTTLELAQRTGGAFVVVPATDWYLRPLPHLRKAGWPATIIRLTDRPTAGSGTTRIWPGYETVRLRGPVGFAGWPAIPDVVAELATTAVVRAWHARMAGQTDVIGTDEYGRPIVSRYLSRRDYETLGRYDIHPRSAGGDRVAWGMH